MCFDVFFFQRNMKPQVSEKPEEIEDFGFEKVKNKKNGRKRRSLDRFSESESNDDEDCVHSVLKTPKRSMKLNGVITRY